MVHGHGTETLLLATLVPIVKDKLEDLCSSKNYRSIAISSLILKLLDWVILLNYSHLLKCDDFHFGFQTNINKNSGKEIKFRPPPPGPWGPIFSFFLKILEGGQLEF